MNGDIEIRFERDEWFDSSGEQLSEICFTNYRLRSFEDTTRLPFAQSYVETTTNFGDGTTKDKEQINEWRVDDADATITVEAGTFEHCVVLSRVSPTATKTYWFARGVGKVYELSPPEEEEELLDWYIA